MVSIRAKATISTLFLVVGALLIGEALNGGVVRNAYGVTEPAFVLRVLMGGVALVIGVRLRTPIEEYVATPSDEPETADPETGEGTEFDPELSPVGGHIEGAERAGEESASGAPTDGPTDGVDAAHADDSASGEGGEERDRVEGASDGEQAAQEEPSDTGGEAAGESGKATSEE